MSMLREIKIKNIQYDILGDQSEAFQKLKEHIEKHGLQNPIIISETSTDKYKVEIGHYRIHACNLLGHKTVIAEIVQGKI